MRFRVDYMAKERESRIVSASHFEKSVAFAPVLRLNVGESISKKYRSAGYRKITRVR